MKRKKGDECEKSIALPFAICYNSDTAKRERGVADKRLEKKRTIGMPQNIDEWIIYVICTIGVISFAISGSLLAMGKRTDPFGTIVIALTTTFGGGILRDIMIGRTPTAFMTDWDCHSWLILVSFVSLIVMILARTGRVAKGIVHLSSGQFLNIVDAIGLAVFCVQGVDSTMKVLSINLHENMNFTNVFILTLMGFTTGVGGGAMRDIFTGQIPMIFRKHIYALPAIGGSLVYVFFCCFPYSWLQIPAMLVVIIGIVFVRVMSAKLHWNLPVFYNRIDEITREEEENKKKKEFEEKLAKRNLLVKKNKKTNSGK